MHNIRVKIISENNFHIKDWAGNICYNGQTFNDFDDAEDFLCMELGDNYDTDRQEYYIMEIE